MRDLKSIEDIIKNEDLSSSQIKELIIYIEKNFTDYKISNNIIHHSGFPHLIKYYPEYLRYKCLKDSLYTYDIKRILEIDGTVLPYVMDCKDFNVFVSENNNFPYHWYGSFCRIKQRELLIPLVPFYYGIEQRFSNFIVITILRKVFYDYTKNTFNSFNQYQHIPSNIKDVLYFVTNHINLDDEELKFKFIYYYNKCCLTNSDKFEFHNLLAKKCNNIKWLEDLQYKASNEKGNEIIFKDNVDNSPKYSFYTNWKKII